ncbi:TM2 domain-containing protein [Staphylococcus coagulans]|uniref:TM2 domain-containing protein n=1 Tax=Staphylococcus coagulans TaxID=74706 RepID=UPI0028720BE0|nr:TM2 domain-containing protein [Staphylococcus coagulans]MDR9833185.1 TM2 domain-containing protein [Staphylococcus coagulans]
MKVNKWISAILAIVLGGGVHKFYSHKIGLGILYALFSWTGIPGLIGFIEGVLVLLKTPYETNEIIVQHSPNILMYLRRASGRMRLAFYPCPFNISKGRFS